MLRENKLFKEFSYNIISSMCRQLIAEIIDTRKEVLVRMNNSNVEA